MNFNTKVNICMQKAYFEKGNSIINYAKYLIAFFGLASQDIYTTMILGVAYGITAYIIGVIWYRSQFIEAEIEVGNIFNIFVKEVRRELNKKQSFINRDNKKESWQTKP